VRLIIGLVVGIIVGSSKKGVVLLLSWSIGWWLVVLVVGWVVGWLDGLGNTTRVEARVG
jgi:hypothetical protein